MAKTGQIKSGTMRVGNSSLTGYGIIYGDEIIGHRVVSTYSDLKNIPAWMFGDITEMNTNKATSSAIGQLWYVTKAETGHSAGFYQLTGFASATKDGTLNSPTWTYFGNGADAVNTTYAFTSGTNGSFSVKPNNGVAQTVSIGKPANAGHADSAGNATNDANGHNIATTYLRKDDFQTIETSINNSINEAKAAATAAQNTANGKISKGGLKTICNKSLEGSGNLSLSDLGIDTTLCEVVTALPEAASAKGGRIYLVKSAASGTDNVFKEYVRLSKNGTSASGMSTITFYWEQLGEWKADVDLTPYVKKSELSKSAVGLGNVDNTSDANKPISTATQRALNNKVDKAIGKDLSTNDFTAAYKSKLDGIAAGANKYSLPTATEGALGGIKAKTISSQFFTVQDQETIVNNLPATTQNNHRLYPVELFYNGRAFVNVPWTDTNTTYNIASTSSNGLMSKEDKTKLNSIGLYGQSFNDTVNNNKGLRLGLTGTDSSIDITIIKSGSDDYAYGLMSGADKKKLDGVATGATRVIVDSELSSTSTNALQNKAIAFYVTALQNKINNKIDSSAFTPITEAEINRLFL